MTAGGDDAPVSTSKRFAGLMESAARAGRGPAGSLHRPDVIALIEEAANKLTGGNKTEAVDLAMRHLLDREARAGSLFAAHRGSVRIRKGIDLIAPALDVEPDAESDREIER